MSQYLSYAILAKMKQSGQDAFFSNMGLINLGFKIVRRTSNKTDGSQRKSWLRFYVLHKSYLQSVKSFHSTFCFVRDHSSHHFEQTLAGTAEVVWSLRRLGVHSLAQVVEHLQLVTVEVSRDTDALTSYHHDTLTGEDLFRDDRRKTTHEMARSINHDNLLETHGYREVILLL